MATLRSSTVGPWQQSIHFYDVWACHPGSWWAFKRASIARIALATLAFGILCAAAVFAPADLDIYKRKDAAFTYLIPFVVKTVSGRALCQEFQQLCPQSLALNSLSAFVARTLPRVPPSCERHRGIATYRLRGAYVAMLCSCFLALRGLSALRTAKRVGAVANGRRKGLAARRHEDARARQIEP